MGERLRADISLKLWDGSVVPLGPGRCEIAFVIRSPAAIRKLILSPRLTTFFELLAAGELDVEGGSLIEAMRRIDREKAGRLVRSLDKRLILKSLWPFLFTSGGGSTPSGYRGAVAERLEGGRDDRQLVQSDVTTGAENDLEQATGLAKQMGRWACPRR